MAPPLEQFVKHLEDSGILAGDTIQEFIPPRAAPKSAEELARELIRQKKLTKFQAELIWQGKGKSLVLGNYVLIEKIGQGGMGAVYKAEHRRMKRVVAIKMLPAAMMNNAAAAARFQREVEAAAKLRHTNIVAADDADEANGVHFLVMECVEGSDLSAMVKKHGPFPLAQAVNYILQAARGLEFAHREGVVHRDIKPANLLLDKRGTVKILDMGLARIQGDTAGQAELTGTGAVMGTVDYMPPEQALNTKTADARADIYSLGCSLYYLLSGKATYDGDTLMAKLLAHRDQPIPDLRAVCPQVSAPLETVFKKMVAKKVEDRYQTMTEVIADLERCIAGSAAAVSAPPASSIDLEGSALSFLKDIPAVPATQKSRIKSRTKATPAGKQAAAPPPWKNKSALIGAALLGLLILAGIVISLDSDEGTLTVTVDQSEAQVQVDGGEITVSEKGGGKVTIAVDPGKHRLKVTKDGFTVFGQEFEMESGGKRSITAHLVPVKAKAKSAPSTPTSTPSARPATEVAQPAPATPPAKDGLQGDWSAVGVEEVNGKPLPAVTGKQFHFTDGKLVMTRLNNGVFAKYEGTYTADAAAKHFDFSGIGPGGKPVAWKGIYQREGDSLTLCYKYVKDGGTTRPTEFRTDDQAGTPFVMVVLRRGPAAGQPASAAPRDAAVFEGHAYQFFKEVLDWQQARRRCEELGGHLAVITSTAENSFVAELAKKHLPQMGAMDGVWLGATEDQKEGEWRWTDGKPLDFTKWGPGQPNNKGNNEHYLLLYLAESVWSDQPAKSVQHTAYFVCEWDAPPKSAAISQPAAEDGQGWVSLFNGRNLEGWKPQPGDAAKWDVKDGILVGSGPGPGHLFSERGDYANFHFRVEARISDLGNSGQYFRAKFEGGFPPGYEAQINSTKLDEKTGSLYGLVPIQEMLVKPDEWFTQEVIADGNHIVILVNGNKVVDYVDRDNKYTSGHLALQHNRGAPGKDTIAEFRKIEVKEISARSAASPTRPAGDNVPPAGFTALFNGTDLTGWKGVVPINKRTQLSATELAAAQAASDQKTLSHWTVREGVLHYDGKGDSLQTVQDFGDFELWLDWKIGPKGDSGIYLRGLPQVQVWDNPIGSGGLYNNQKHPSTPLQAGDKPIGEWNTFHITMIGEAVTIQLNDVLVVDKVTLENYWDRSQPVPALGPIELQHHGGILEFKNIFLKKL